MEGHGGQPLADASILGGKGLTSRTAKTMSTTGRLSRGRKPM